MAFSFLKKKPTAKPTRIFYATDLHGSERTYRKFINAGKFYEVRVLIMGGDILGKLCTITIDDRALVYGGEPVYAEGKLLSRLRSGGYGYTVSKMIGLVYLPRELTPFGTPLEVECFGERFPAEVAADVLHDPKGERLRI